MPISMLNQQMDKCEVFVAANLEERLLQQCRLASTDTLIGYLVGIRHANELHIIGCSVCSESGDGQLSLEFDRARRHLPVGLELCGVLVSETESDSKNVFLKNIIQNIQPILGDDGELLVWSLKSDADSCLTRYDDDGQHTVQYRQLDADQVMTNAVMFRLTALLPISFEHSSDTGKLDSNITSAIEVLQERVSNSNIAAFHLHGSDIIFERDPESEHFGCMPASTTFADLYVHLSSKVDENDFGGRKKKQRVTDFSKVSIPVRLLLRLTEKMGSQPPCVPVIHHSHRNFKNVRFSLPIDVIVYTSSMDAVSLLAGRLTAAVCQQLDSLRDCILQYADNGTVYTPKAYLFRPKSLNHAISVIYPETVDEDKLEPLRRVVHQQFLLPLDRPLLRRTSQPHLPSDDLISSIYLVSPHFGLPQSGVQEGRVSVVDGDYDYHHYMQDNKDDNGWGCAYRSLQTLVSWFRWQGYTSQPVPTHTQIQQVLVDIGDKPASFVNSRQWIGSTEVSYVLNQLIGVTSKMIFVSSGSEVGTKARELAAHFQKNGSPVMIGGGVLAHTILGVDFNEMTGEVKFLILDPHYTGGENLKTVQDKGWCGWKGADFWDPNAYYNMCLPLRPQML